MKSPRKGSGPEPSKEIETKPPMAETVVQTAASASKNVTGPVGAEEPIGLAEDFQGATASSESGPASVNVIDAAPGVETIASPPIAPHVSPFEAIRRVDEDGNEFWSSRDLAKVLSYGDYTNMERVVGKAKKACFNSGQALEDHFRDVAEMIAIGKGGKRGFNTVHLSRYACYLVIQNADPTKDTVALGQTYFAVQTRRQELADNGDAQAIEDRRRLVIRAEVREHNVNLADAAKGAGVLEPIDYAIFQNHGYMGLYGGLGAKAIHARKGLKRSQEILDHMGSSELAANLFRATQTEEKLRREGITGKANANRAHEEVGKKVRQTIAELGGTLPEDHPSAESIKVLEARERQANKTGKGSAGGK